MTSASGNSGRPRSCSGSGTVRHNSYSRDCATTQPVESWPTQRLDCDLLKFTRPEIEFDINYAHADVSSFEFVKPLGIKKQDRILPETSMKI